MHLLQLSCILSSDCSNLVCGIPLLVSVVRKPIRLWWQKPASPTGKLILTHSHAPKRETIFQGDLYHRPARESLSGHFQTSFFSPWGSSCGSKPIHAISYNSNHLHCPMSFSEFQPGFSSYVHCELPT